MSRLDDLLAGRHLIRSSLNLDAPAPAVKRVDLEATSANVRQQQLDDKVTAIKLANAPEVESTGAVIAPATTDGRQQLVDDIAAAVRLAKKVKVKDDAYNRHKTNFEAWLVSKGADLGDKQSIRRVLYETGERKEIVQAFDKDGLEFKTFSAFKDFWDRYIKKIDYSKAKYMDEMIN